MNDLKTFVLAFSGSAGAVIAQFLGGWDWALQTLIIFISVDFILGVLLAAIWGKSSKSESGSIESRACLKGLFRKGGILLTVLVAAQLDALVGTGSFCRTAVIIYFIGNEGISITENLGIMGVPFPKWLKNKFETLKEDNGKK